MTAARCFAVLSHREHRGYPAAHPQISFSNPQEQTLCALCPLWQTKRRWLMVTMLATFACADGEAAPNSLTAAEVEDGWQLLFDGESTNGWRGYNRDGFPSEAWEVRDRNLVTLAQEDGGSGVDLVTEERFENFELSI